MWYGGPGHGGYEFQKIPTPKKIKDVPGYVKVILSGFFGRLGYTFALVWKADPLILFTMLFISVFDGVMAPVGTLISARVISEMQIVIEQRAKVQPEQVLSGHRQF